MNKPGKITYSSIEELEKRLSDMEEDRERAYQAIDKALSDFKKETGCDLFITVKKAPPGKAYGLMIIIEA